MNAFSIPAPTDIRVMTAMSVLDRIASQYSSYEIKPIITKDILKLTDELEGRSFPKQDGSSKIAQNRLNKDRAELIREKLTELNIYGHHTALVRVAQAISSKSYEHKVGHIPLIGRTEKRSKDALLKWFSDNWDELLPWLQSIQPNVEIPPKVNRQKTQK